MAGKGHYQVLWSMSRTHNFCPYTELAVSDDYGQFRKHATFVHTQSFDQEGNVVWCVGGEGRGGGKVFVEN